MGRFFTKCTHFIFVCSCQSHVVTLVRNRRHYCSYVCANMLQTIFKKLQHRPSFIIPIWVNRQFIIHDTVQKKPRRVRYQIHFHTVRPGFVTTLALRSSEEKLPHSRSDLLQRGTWTEGLLFVLSTLACASQKTFSSLCSIIWENRQDRGSSPAPTNCSTGTWKEMSL